jgi:hypothetical protein
MKMKLHLWEVLYTLDENQKIERPQWDREKVVHLKARISRRPGLWREQMTSRNRRPSGDDPPLPEAA